MKREMPRRPSPLARLLVWWAVTRHWLETDAINNEWMMAVLFVGILAFTLALLVLNGMAFY